MDTRTVIPAKEGKSLSKVQCFHTHGLVQLLACGVKVLTYHLP